MNAQQHTNTGAGSAFLSEIAVVALRMEETHLLFVQPDEGITGAQAFDAMAMHGDARDWMMLPETFSGMGGNLQASTAMRLCL